MAYLGGMGCSGCGGTCGMSGLGLDPGTAAIASSLISAASKSGGGSGASSGGAMMPNINVNPSFQTQISPQISPVFQQQFQPNNSALTAGTSQYMPTNQSAPGAAAGPVPSVPGFPDAGMPSPMAQPVGLPNINPMNSGGQIVGLSNKGYLVLGAAALFLLVMAMKKKRGGIRTYKSTSQALAVR